MNMITIDLQGIAKRLNKTISDISRETGLNRNTVTALYHNQVNGIKLETLNKICDTYTVSVGDLISYVAEQSHPVEAEEVATSIRNPYKQEAECVPFTVWAGMIVATRKRTAHFSAGADRLACYYKEHYGEIFWEKDQLDGLARQMYAQYSDAESVDALYNCYLEASQALEDMYRATSDDQIVALDEQELLRFFQKLYANYLSFWEPSLFIDGFDAGFDHEKISEIQEEYGFSSDEVAILTNPVEMTFGNERLLSLLNIVAHLRERNTIDAEVLRAFVSESKEVAKYRKDFDYYKSNYAHVVHILEDDVVTEIQKYLRDDALFRKEFDHLRSYSDRQRDAVQKILESKGLSTNPLYFFQRLTYWREHRKKVNLMGIHLMNAVLLSIEKKTGIPRKYLTYLSVDEVGHVLRGLITGDVLRSRFERGVLLLVHDEQYKMLEGQEALSLKKDIDQRVGGASSGGVIPGQVASQGYARGVARIILGTEDFDRLQEGEILVTGMTRPEFVPIMKKAAAIVTNEGGITCHAAIVSRELNKPCIIGTQRATQLIQDGDIVEVRAHHGTVRVLGS